jgi:hypothetical protein
MEKVLFFGFRSGFPKNSPKKIAFSNLKGRGRRGLDWRGWGRNVPRYD